MKNIRKLLLVAITSFMLVISSVAVASESDNDLDLLFGSSATQSMELQSLSDAEMVATEGEFICGSFCIVATIIAAVIADRYINRLLDNMGW
jgi:hypothetical protein